MRSVRPLLLVLAMALIASLIDCSAPQQSLVVPRGATFARSGATTATETLLHSFAGNSDGSYPNSSLVAVKSLFFGTTSNGGSGGCTKVDGCGTVYTIDASGNETVVTAFKGATDGEAPNQLLLDSDTTFYGTTQYGGSSAARSNEAIRPDVARSFSFPLPARKRLFIASQAVKKGRFHPPG
jgi:hypothetical protein